MALYDLSDRLNWQQACEVLGCGKTHLYALVKEGKLHMYGTGKRYRWFSRNDLEVILEKRTFKRDAGENLPSRRNIAILKDKKGGKCANTHRPVWGTSPASKSLASITPRRNATSYGATAFRGS